MMTMAGTISTKSMHLGGMVLQLKTGAKFILDGKTIIVSKDWKVKGYDFEDGVLKVKNLDGSTSDYRVNEDFSYPQDAETHYLSGAHIDADAVQ